MENIANKQDCIAHPVSLDFVQQKGYQYNYILFYWFKETMSRNNRRYIVSVCHCVIGDISRRKIPFNYVPDDLVYNDYHNVRNNCRCNSGKLHYFGYIYCYRHLD